MFDFTLPLELSSGHEIVRVSREPDGMRVFYQYNSQSYEHSCLVDVETGVAIGSEGEEQPLAVRKRGEAQPVPKFEIHGGQPDWPKTSWLRIRGEVYDNGGTAAARSKELNALGGLYRFMVKKTSIDNIVAPVEQWAKERFECGRWQKLPWADEDFAHDDFIANHHAHRAITNPEHVAFYQSKEDAATDKVTVMLPGRYLYNFYPDMDPSVREQWVAKMTIEVVIEFATTPEEIVKVYKSGPRSCMSYNDDEYSCSGHPTRIYGAGDLAVAYYKRGNSISGRALCWPEKKIYGRIYGDEMRMVRGLEQIGYREDGCSGSFEGARLLAIESNGAYVMPYLDSDYCAEVSNTTGYLYMSHDGSINAQQTNGLSEDGHDSCCDMCEEGYWADNEGGYVNGNNYCGGCWDERISTCDDCEDSYDHEDGGGHVDDGQKYVCMGCLRNYPVCEGCDLVVSETSTVVRSGGEVEYCEECREGIPECGICGVPNESTSPLGELDQVCESCESDEAVTKCSGCESFHKTDEMITGPEGSLCSGCNTSEAATPTTNNNTNIEEAA